jgi:hypothetical protein
VEKSSVVLHQGVDIGGQEVIVELPADMPPAMVAVHRVLSGDDDWYGLGEIAVANGASVGALVEAALEHGLEHIAKIWMNL